MVETDGRQPAPVRQGPIPALAKAPMAQQKPGQLPARPAQGAHRGGPGPDQIAHRLGIGVGHPDRGQDAGPVQPGQAQGVAAVGFDPIAGLARDQRRGHHHAVMAQRPQVAPDPMAARTGLVAEAQLPALARQSGGEFGQNLRRVVDRPHKSCRAAQAVLGQRHRKRLLVNVQAHERDSLSHDPSPMHEARRRTIRRNPRHLHTVRRVTQPQSDMGSRGHYQGELSP